MSTTPVELTPAGLPKRKPLPGSDTLSGWADDSRNEEGWNKDRPFPKEEPVFERLSEAELLAWSLVDQGSSRAAMVEVLAAYSHTVQAVDVWLCYTAALTNPVRAPSPSANVHGACATASMSATSPT